MSKRNQKKVASKGRSRDPRRAVDVHSKCMLETIIELLGLSYAALQPGGERREKQHELSEQNSKLSKKLKAERKRLVEFRQEVEKSSIEGWWQAPLDQLSLEDLKLYKREYEQLSKIFAQAIEDRTTDCHGFNSDDPPRNDS
ncbi:hypothetical protein BT93_B0529 [Corymbia citriodora subsp. variegata]|nr:hypothetical protein BT93_B0529 [Corymbia citriodora subsp. variegata]